MMTELEALNQVLSVTGDAAVTSVASTYEQAIIARRILDEVNREQQAKGLWFNEIDELLILQDAGTGEVNLPAETLRVDVPSDYGNLVQRGLKLFDKSTNSYVIEEDIYVNLVVELEWTLLPQSFRQYVTALAKLRYNAEYFGSQETQQTVQGDVARYGLEVEREDIDNRDLNMIKSTRANNIAFKNRRG